MGTVTYLPRPVLSPDLRARVEQTIDWLVGLLDAVETPDDNEAENEHGSDDDAGEETLGWPAHMKQSDLGPNTADGDHTAPERHGGGFVRCMADDIEPSLGAPEQTPDDFIVVNGRCVDLEPDQTYWAAGSRDDREGDLSDTADDREHDECDRGEPWLGAPETTNYGQTESRPKKHSRP